MYWDEQMTGKWSFTPLRSTPACSGERFDLQPRSRRVHEALSLISLCLSTSESSSLSLHPSVNVEDVDSEHERGGGEGLGSVPKILTPQDPKLTTLAVPVNPSGSRQR